MQHLFPDNQLPLEYATNVCLPTYGEQQHNFLANTHFSPLPSPTSAEGFAVTARHLPYGNLHTSNATGTVDFSMASNPGSSQPHWPQSDISASMMHQKRASLPQIRTQCQTPPGFLCGWSRDDEPPPAFPSFPSNTQSLSPTLAHSYSNAGQHDHDAWMSHFFGKNQDICPSSPDWDTPLSASGFLRDLADCDYNFNACADPQPSIAPTHNIPVPPPVLLRSEPICGLGRQTRNSHCQWLTMNGSSCDRLINADRRSVIEHLQRAHGIRTGEEKARQTCMWEGCSTILNKESLARHILAVHLKEKVHCPECGLFFAREDSLKRHLKGGQHRASSDKNAARQNRSGSG
ncbi:hypothetical protein L210DRAFT_909913 [Boletus edulis BED1]|uniref:C2H2-type domain-containing protein n=1 Tax=Boletus edulis BED1 TaxID=1328754 RepID=A0AAD4BXF3_BOLED|nr:hypothetical protein L210DRAFT_909913 [Boletus edulis BED1]